MVDRQHQEPTRPQRSVETQYRNESNTMKSFHCPVLFEKTGHGATQVVLNVIGLAPI